MLDLTPLDSQSLIEEIDAYYLERDCVFGTFEWVVDVWIVDGGKTYCRLESGEVVETDLLVY